MYTTQRLAALFTFLGIAASGVVCESLRTGCFAHDAPIVPALGVLVPLGMGATGALVATLAPKMRATAWGFASAASLLATGALVGAVAGLLYMPAHGGLAFGAHDGLAYAGAVLLVSLPLLALTRRFCRARPRSLAAGSHYLVLWAAAGLAMTSLCAIARPRSFPFCPGEASTGASAFVAFAGATIALVAAGVAIARAARARATFERGLLPLDVRCMAGRVVDLGIGDGEWHPRGPRSAYRDGHPIDVLYIGDPREALAALRADIAWAFLLGLATPLLALLV